MNTLFKKRMAAITSTIGEDGHSYSFVVSMNAAVQQDNRTAILNALDNYLGEMRFGGERFCSAPGEAETINLLISYVGPDALRSFINSATHIVVKDGSLLDDQRQYQGLYGLGRILGDIHGTVAGDLSHTLHPEFVASIQPEVFDLSRCALTEARKVEALATANNVLPLLRVVEDRANRLYSWAIKGVEPEVRAEGAAVSALLKGKDDLTL